MQGGAHGQFAAVPLNLCGTYPGLLAACARCYVRCLAADGGLLQATRGRRSISTAAFGAGARTRKPLSTQMRSGRHHVVRCPATGELRYPDVSDWCVTSFSCWICGTWVLPAPVSGAVPLNPATQTTMGSPSKQALSQGTVFPTFRIQHRAGEGWLSSLAACTRVLVYCAHRCITAGLRCRGVDSDAAYVHIVTNETIDGVELGDPDVGDAVLVSDMTSTLLSRCDLQADRRARSRQQTLSRAYMHECSAAGTTRAVAFELGQLELHCGHMRMRSQTAVPGCNTLLHPLTVPHQPRTLPSSVQARRRVQVRRHLRQRRQEFGPSRRMRRHCARGPARLRHAHGACALLSHNSALCVVETQQPV